MDLSNINGHIISYYYHCKRRCWLSFNRINFELDSEDVRIGKLLHELQNDENSEIKIDGIAIDKIKGKYLIEYKKADSDETADEMQVLLYLYILKNKGVVLKGKLEYFDDTPAKIIILDENNEKKLEETINEISILLNKEFPPPFKKESKCRKCAYYDYCNS